MDATTHPLPQLRRTPKAPNAGSCYPRPLSFPVVTLRLDPGPIVESFVSIEAYSGFANAVKPPVGSASFAGLDGWFWGMAGCVARRRGDGTQQLCRQPRLCYDRCIAESASRPHAVAVHGHRNRFGHLHRTGATKCRGDGKPWPRPSKPMSATLWTTRRWGQSIGESWRSSPPAISST